MRGMMPRQGYAHQGRKKKLGHGQRRDPVESSMGIAKVRNAVRHHLVTSPYAGTAYMTLRVRARESSRAFPTGYVMWLSAPTHHGVNSAA